MNKDKIYSYYFGRYMTIEDIRNERRKAHTSQDNETFELAISLEQKLFKNSK